MTEKSIYYKIREYIDNAIEMNQNLTLNWKEAVELRGYIKSLEEMYAIESKEYNQEIACKDEIIALLKEDAERLASNVYTTIDEDGNTWCVACHNYNDEHTEYCPITLHRALMKELE